MGKTSAEKHAAGKRNRQHDNRGTKKGQGALKAGSAFKKSNASGQVGRTTPNGTKRVKEGGGTHFRTEGAIKRLKMYKSKPNVQKMREQASAPMRIQPDRRWFGNTRVIAQDKMQQFRETLSKKVEDPFSVVLRSSKLPMSLLRETEDKSSHMDLLSVEPFKEVFGKKRRQKRVKLANYDMEGLLESVDKKADDYDEKKDTQARVDFSTGVVRTAEDNFHGEEIFLKGTSKRIWGELWKVVDSSDVLIFVLDARDPQGTRCEALEREIKKNRAHKHIILLINKVDLVPTWVTRRWVQVLMKEFPTIAFHASITNPFGKNALLNLTRQFGNLLKEKKHITVGMIGYPNVGKSSVINTMKHKKVCKAAPVPGETKVWQYIALTKKIYMLDCPGIVTGGGKSHEADIAKVLKGVVRAERIESPSDYIDEVLSRVKKQYLLQRFKLPADTTWKDAEEFLTILGAKMGKMKKGGEVDIEITARIVLYDWQRGRIPYFTPPPDENGKPMTGAEAAKAAKAAEAPAVAGAAAAAEAEEGDITGDEGTDEEAEKIAEQLSQELKKAAPSAEDEPEVETGAAAASSSGDNRHNRGSEGPAVQQNLGGLSEIQCALDFDEDDHGGQVPAGSSGSGGAAGTKRTTDTSGLPKSRKAKKARRGKGGSGGAGSASGGRGGDRDQQSATTADTARRAGSVDWKAVVSEFAM